ncbi:MAG: hypothetical protein CMI01_02225 [Oceanospirillaceae bacterium]|jgi:hypothetical protein|nr:hypothetical protein [Oceanospirillaceae bacterium]
MNKKALITALLFSFTAPVALADSGHLSHHSGNQQANGQTAAMPGPMADPINQMSELVERMATTQEADARTELLQQHSQMVEQMRGMMGGGAGMMSGGMMQGGSMMGQGFNMQGMMGEQCPLHESMMETINQMDKRMDLMQQMIDRLAAEKNS